MKCVILQPSYIPWRGYFHLIQKADLFVFYDDVQYDKDGWRNRNKIKTPEGTRWLTIPVRSGGKFANQTQIRAMEMLWDKPWNKNHRQTLHQFYRKAPFYRKYSDLLDGIYEPQQKLLADFTIESTVRLAREIGIEHTRFMRSSELKAEGAKTDRLISILKKVGANHYISGPSAKSYLEEEKLAQAGITFEYMRYEYAAYEQLYGAYEPQVSILDVLLMTGPEAPRLIWGAREGTGTPVASAVEPAAGASTW